MIQLASLAILASDQHRGCVGRANGCQAEIACWRWTAVSCDPASSCMRLHQMHVSTSLDEVIRCRMQQSRSCGFMSWAKRMY